MQKEASSVFDSLLSSWLAGGFLLFKTLGDKGDGSVPTEPRLELQTEAFDFGAITQDKKVSYDVAFRNSGDQPLSMRDLRSSCGCLALAASRKRLGPRESGTIELTLNPVGKRGRIAKTVNIYSNDARDPVKTLTVFATVTHGVAVVPGTPLETVLFKAKCRECHADPARGKSGKALYVAVCAMCHGAKGEGKKTTGPPLVERPDAEMRRLIAEGQPGSGMAGYAKERGGPLDAEQVESLVRYSRRMQRTRE
jgi:mono/diheme cytochrome c family protein